MAAKPKADSASSLTVIRRRRVLSIKRRYSPASLHVWRVAVAQRQGCPGIEMPAMDDRDDNKARTSAGKGEPGGPGVGGGSVHRDVGDPGAPFRVLRLRRPAGHHPRQV